MEPIVFPLFIDVFLAPVRDNAIVQAAMFALLILILCDILFGATNALMKHCFSSKVMREGIAHKMSELGFVIIGIIIDGLFFAGMNLGFNGPILGFIVGFLCVMEIGSLLEIIADMNPKLKDNKLFKMLESVKEPEVDDGEQ